MQNQSRTFKVWISLIAAMTSGAVILLALDNQTPDAGAFSLASYTQLKAVEDSLVFNAQLDSNRWDKIEVSFSNTQAGNIQSLALINNLSSSDEVNSHFVVCNGKGGEDGLIQPTTRWKKQYPCLSGHDWFGSRSTIRVFVIANQVDSLPTDCQISRIEKLLDALCKKCNITVDQIEYPQGWQ